MMYTIVRCDHTQRRVPPPPPPAAACGSGAARPCNNISAAGSITIQYFCRNVFGFRSLASGPSVPGGASGPGPAQWKLGAHLPWGFSLGAIRGSETAAVLPNFQETMLTPSMSAVWEQSYEGVEPASARQRAFSDATRKRSVSLGLVGTRIRVEGAPCTEVPDTTKVGSMVQAMLEGEAQLLDILDGIGRLKTTARPATATTALYTALQVVLVVLPLYSAHLQTKPTRKNEQRAREPPPPTPHDLPLRRCSSS
eukprot:scaffold7388_cov399-Prasinococcus_capsulatus_cf.AAC.3